MKTLSQLIKEAEERYDKIFFVINQKLPDLADEYRLFLKTELETIVKESFKNTRVEEKIFGAISRVYIAGDKSEEYQRGFVNALMMVKSELMKALSDTEIKQNQFLNN